MSALLFTDDAVLLGKSEEQLQKLTNLILHVRGGTER